MGVGVGVLVVSVLVALSVLLVVRVLRRSRWSSDSVQLDDESAHGTSRNRVAVVEGVLVASSWEGRESRRYSHQY